MEIEKVEFTAEDILDIHHAWIREMYTQDRKTDAEIVAILSQQNLTVTTSQVQACIREWNLQPPPIFHPSPALEELLSQINVQNALKRRNQISRFRLSPIQNSQICSFLPPSNPHLGTTQRIAPADQELYSTRPLPALPDSDTLNSSPNLRVPPSIPQMRRRCLHGNDPEDCTVLGDSLAVLPTGQSSIKRYVQTDEFHEKVSVGIFGNTGPGKLFGCAPAQGVTTGSTSTSSSTPPCPGPGEQVKEVKEVKEVAQEEVKTQHSAITADDTSDEVIELKYVRARDRSHGSKAKMETTVRVRYGKDKNRSKDGTKSKGKEKEVVDEEVPKEEDRKRKRIEDNDKETQS